MSVLPPFMLHRPESIGEALEVLSFDDIPVAGGTELLLAMRMRVLRPTSLVSLRHIPGLGGVEVDGAEIVIGGRTTHQAAADSPLIRQHLPILAEVLNQVGNPRVRASGTLAGNLVFAEPKSDVIPILLGLDAHVVLTSPDGTRTLDIDQFIIGPYYSAREPNELLTQIRIPIGHIDRAVYLKYQTMERPTVGVAALDLGTDGDRVRRLVVGAVAERSHLIDFSPSDAISGEAIAAEIEPIPDIAGSKEYKRHVTGVYIDRAVSSLDELAHS